MQYADIDHYDERKVFTIDDENFAGLPEYFDELRAGGMRTVIILVISDSLLQLIVLIS